MATYFARKAGNINAADVWATTPSGTAAAVTFAAGDVLMANGFAININASVNLGSGQIRNDTFGGAANGGNFAITNSVTLTANVIGIGSGTIGVLNAIGTMSANIVGSITPSTSGSFLTVFFIQSSGTFNIVGDITGINASQSGTVTISSTTSPTLNITGNVIGASGSTLPAIYHQNTAGGGSVNITGNVTGRSLELVGPVPVVVTGIVSGGNVGTAPTITNGANNTITIIGPVIAGPNAVGVFNTSTGTISAKRAVGNNFGPSNSSGLTSRVAISNSGTGIIEIEELEYGTFGQSPTSGAGIRLKKANTNVAVFNYCDTAGAKTLIDATQNSAMPAASNVRSGVSYASGALTGSCAVPAAGSVSLGVPVDAGFGTAILTTANVQSALTAQGLTTARAGALDNLDATVSSRLAPNGTLATVTTLTNAPDVPTEGEIASAVWSAASREITGGVVDTLTNSPDVPTEAEIASQVRTELSVELGRIDAAISSRLAPSGTLATVTTLTNAPTVPTAAAIADEVRVELATELARLDAPVSGATAPSAATVATAVRSELATELARVDQAVSSRLAGSAYTAPANSDVAAIKAKTDALNTERLANVATTAIVGNLIAQANS